VPKTLKTLLHNSIQKRKERADRELNKGIPATDG